jgi:uncharacterized membrane protein
LTQSIVSDRTAKFVLAVDRFAFGVARHWLLYVSVVLGTLVLAPIAAPALMAVGGTGPANVIYTFYSFLCHQLPERSYFLFGPKVSYSLAEIERVRQYDDMLTLRQFIGNNVMGWKVAWSDRMVSLYGGLWIGGLLYALARRRLPRLAPVVWLFLGVLPIFVDGFSHTINDVAAGLSGTGFRDTNAWLQFSTGNVFSATFYAGDALGSFNNLMRNVTGLLFGLLTVWFGFPFIEAAMRDLEYQTRGRLATPRSTRLGFGVSREWVHPEGRQ